MEKPDFDILGDGHLSTLCRKAGHRSFAEVMNSVKALPYRRISDKNKLELVIKEHCGTCSTKHGFLAALAKENGFQDLKLQLGIFCMSSKNTPGVTEILKEHRMSYIPEAHNYLLYKGKRIDITGLDESVESPFESLLYETEIQITQIGDFKTNIHKAFLEKWLLQNKTDYTLEQIWKIREDCISALALTPKGQ